jgi:membrane-bound metal-dependent hydrolase YbcI (DUF457 family)
VGGLMDTVTHGIVGALIGKAFFSEDSGPAAPSWREPPSNAGRVAVISATLGAIFPDIDVFAGPLAHNSLALITWHRNITHSLVVLPLWAVLLAFLTRGLAARIRWPAPSMGTLIGIYAAGLVSHIFLDVLTSFGTMVWSPLNYARPAWDWLFIIDLVLTSLALVPQLAAWAFRRADGAERRAVALWALLSAAAFAIAALARSINLSFSTTAVAGASLAFAGFLILPLRRGSGIRTGRTKWCRIGVALVLSYLIFAGGMHHTALQRVTQFADEQGLRYQSVAVVPLPPSAAHWAGLITTPEGVYRVEFSQFGGDPVQIQYFNQPQPSRYLDAAREVPDMQKFLWFARFPVARVLDRDGQSVVQITDLRFYGNRPQAPRPAADAAFDGGFTFEVVFGQDGRVLSDHWHLPN